MLRVATIVLLIASLARCHQETLSVVDSDRYSVQKDKRYLLYDVNRGEGFNLRRDVNMRVANTVRLLRESGENFVLVLPPWGGLYHWDRQETRKPWSTYFDTKNMGEFVPVMEFHEYLQENPHNSIDQVVYLQHYAEGWGTEYVMKYDKRKCSDGDKYYKQNGDSWKGWFFSYDKVRAKSFECVSIQGDSSHLRDLVLKEYADKDSIFIDRAETILHQHYGERDYWQARRSMRYANHLMAIANEFRKTEMDSDESDDIMLPASWRDEKASRQTKGGNYVCAHWRRRDFVRAHGKELPSVRGTSKILNELVKKEQVNYIYLATDATAAEVEELTDLVDVPIKRYTEKDLTDGEIAVVDQVICARARYFIGTHVSTFSFRIQEDREILGFPAESTFNRMCPDGQSECEQPAKWRIVY